MWEFSLRMNRIKVSLKVLTIPRRTGIEIVHANFSGSQMGDPITIILYVSWFSQYERKHWWWGMRRQKRKPSPGTQSDIPAACVEWRDPPKKKSVNSHTVSVCQNLSLRFHLMLVNNSLFPICNTWLTERRARRYSITGRSRRSKHKDNKDPPSGLNGGRGNVEVMYAWGQVTLIYYKLTAPSQRRDGWSQTASQLEAFYWFSARKMPEYTWNQYIFKGV